jgi:hypothetical protein
MFLRHALSALLLAAFIPAVLSYQTPTPPSLSRRAFGAAASAALVGFGTSAAANAIEACPKGSKNCIRTTWTPPAGVTPSQADVAQTIRAVLLEYPQAGQQDVDKGGWELVQDDLTKAGTARIEYKSGIGKFAKFFNGGKPFVDDLTLEIVDNGANVQVRSASRVGDSDFGVNQKRLEYLGTALKAQGWTVPDPKY